MFSLRFGAQAEPHWIIAQRGQARGHRHITEITAFEPPSSHKSEKSKGSERRRLRGKFRWAECRRIEDGTLLAFLVRTAPSCLLGFPVAPSSAVPLPLPALMSRCRSVARLAEITLCSPGQKALTT